MTDRPSWEDSAACRAADVDPAWFFPDSDGKPTAILRAFAVCERCPVSRQCHEAAERRHEHHGVWGGMNRAWSAKRRRPARLAVMQAIWAEQGATPAPTPTPRPDAVVIELHQPTRVTLPKAKRGPQPKHGSRRSWERRGCQCIDCKRAAHQNARERAAEALS